MSNNYRYNIIVGLLVLLITLIISHTNFFNWIDNNIYDLFISQTKSSHKPDNIILIKIDEKSISKLGQWPWKRDIYAKFTNSILKLKPEVVAFYIDFSLPANFYNDSELINSFKARPIVIINPYLYLKENPDNKFWATLKKQSSWGHDKLITSSDGVVRNQSPVLNHMPSFALSVLNHYNPNNFNYSRENNVLKLKSQIFDKINNEKLLINYKHSWNQFSAYSFIDVFENKISPKVFKNKIIIIGLTQETMVKDFTTPFSKLYSYSGKDASVYIQAQIIDSVLNFDPIKKINYNILFLVLIILIPLEICLLRYCNTIIQITILIIVIPLLCITLSFYLLYSSSVWLSSTIFLLSNIILFVTLVTGQIFKISRFLDNYIVELSKKTDKNKVIIESAVDSKLERLKEITNIIEKDRSIFDTVLASTSSIIILFDQSGKIIYSNCDKKNLILQDYSSLINFEEAISIVKKDDFYKKDLIYNNIHYEFIANKASKDYYVVVFNNITDRVHSNELKASILRMLSHELKAPISTILLSSDYLLNHIKEPRFNSYLEKILNQADFIQELIDKFLELNKLEVTELELLKENSDINDIITNIIENFLVIAGNKNIKIETHLLSEPKNIFCDKNYLTIAFKNILDNAIKYSPADTTISVSIEIIKDYCKISFKDQGFGIAEEDIEKLFNKFYRIKNIKTSLIRGSGLGLSFVKKIIDLHQGDIIVKSSVNNGSNFIISIPLSEK